MKSLCKSITELLLIALVVMCILLALVAVNLWLFSVIAELIGGKAALVVVAVCVVAMAAMAEAEA